MVSSHIQVDCLAKAIYHEARGETYEGQLYVGYVIKNRVRAKGFPNNFCAVIEQPGQFTFDPKSGMFEQKSKKMAKDIATRIINDKHQPIDENVLFYHTKKCKPKWKFKELRKYAVLGEHVFYTRRS